MNYLKQFAIFVAGGSVAGAAYFVPENSFLAFVAGWLFLVPAAVVIFLGYGLTKYMKDRKNRITVSIKPNDALKAIARREAELHREKQLILEEIRKG
ncbi:Uncharacterised protein [uncultured archaeon]|nr:Uncharacterised protein [uncultured archaeon]